MAFNKVILMGNLTADPEARTTTSGQSVTSFTLAINRNFRGADGNRREETSFINCTAWGATGETIAKYTSKGRQLLVSGRLQQRSWDDKETGKRRSTIDVIVEDFSFINDGRNNQASRNDTTAGADTNVAPATPSVDIEEPINLDDIPF